MVDVANVCPEPPTVKICVVLGALFVAPPPNSGQLDRMQGALGGLITSICALESGFIRYEPGMTALIWVEVMLVVLMAVCTPNVATPVYVTVELPLVEVGRKLVPVRVIVTLAQFLVQTAAFVGEMEVSTGTGLGAPATINAKEFERPFMPVPDCGANTFT